MEYEVKSFLLFLLAHTEADYRIEHLEDNEADDTTIDNRRHNTDHLLTHLSSVIPSPRPTPPSPSATNTPVKRAPIVPPTPCTPKASRESS